MLRIFGLSLATTAVALVVAFLYGGAAGLLTCFILGIFEVSFSFDNAVVNATVLARLDDRWQRIFLTVGVPVATFGMRFTLPMVVVWATSSLSPFQAWTLAMHRDPRYGMYLHHAHPLIMAFGTFLMMLFLLWAFEDREVQWLSWLERPLARAGRLDMLAVVVTLAALVGASSAAVATHRLPADRFATVLISGLLGVVSFIVIKGFGDLFNTEEYDAGAAVTKVFGRAAFFSFLYLEMLDASMSFDGVIGAFAITSDPILIALGLGLIGSMFVRSLTVFLIRKGTLAKYVYLEHGAMWAIGALSALMLISLVTYVNDMVTGLVGVVLIAIAFATSVVRLRRQPADVDWGQPGVLDEALNESVA